MEREALESLVRWLRTGDPPAAASPEHAARLGEVAHEQRLAPLLYGAVAGRPDWPETAIARLRDRYHAAFARGVRQLALADAVLGLCEAASVRALPMKGAALAERVYDSVAERPMADVDVLVLDRWRDATAALAGEGYVEIAHADHAWAFRSPEGGVVELHHAVTSCPGLFPLDAAGVWQRSRLASGQVRRVPSAEDLLLQLALHGAFQHGLVLSLGQYLDFARLLTRDPIGTGALRRIAEAAGAVPVLAITLAVADALLGLDLPSELRAWSSEEIPWGLRRWLAAELREPVGLLAPRRLPLARVRWGLCHGRRARLVALTLSPPDPDATVAWPRRVAAGAARAAGLARRWWRPR